MVITTGLPRICALARRDMQSTLAEAIYVFGVLLREGGLRLPVAAPADATIGQPMLCSS